MKTRKYDLLDIDTAELAPIPEVPENYGPRNAEELRILEKVQEALAGKFVPLDDSFFDDESSSCRGGTLLCARGS